jgi:hypothetical protein
VTQPPEENPSSQPADENPFSQPSSDGVELTPQPPASVPPPPPPPAPAAPSTPPPPPPAYAPAAPAAPGYGGAAYGAVASPQNSQGTIALVTGILGLLCCGLLAIVAIFTGRNGMQLAAEGKATNGGMAKAGYWLGIIAVILWVLGIIFTVATGGFHFSAGTS